MNIYKAENIGQLIHDNPYVGRGIVAGTSPDGKAAAAYFIMGRSANSSNRIFEKTADNELYTRPFDESKVQDPSLIIYAALRSYEDKLVFTNGDQTDTVIEGFQANKSFKEALESRCFEPDAPNYTPRISAVEYLGKADFCYELSILKSIDAEGSDCARYTFSYPAKPGLGHFIHTYVTDGNPIPTFQGEPERVEIPADIDAFTKDLWENLNEDNKISLYVRYTDPVSGEFTDRLINKYQ